jgi:hypothetical protein
MKKILSIIAFLVISVGMFAAISHDRVINGGTIDLTSPAQSGNVWNLSFGGGTGDTISSLVGTDTIEYTISVTHNFIAVALLQVKIDTFGTVRDTAITMNVFQSNLSSGTWNTIKTTGHSAVSTTFTPLKDNWFDFSFREWAINLEGTQIKFQFIAPHAATSRGVKARLTFQLKVQNY